MYRSSTSFKNIPNVLILVMYSSERFVCISSLHLCRQFCEGGTINSIFGRGHLLNVCTKLHSNSFF